MHKNQSYYENITVASTQAPIISYKNVNDSILISYWLNVAYTLVYERNTLSTAIIVSFAQYMVRIY